MNHIYYQTISVRFSFEIIVRNNFIKAKFSLRNEAYTRLVYKSIATFNIYMSSYFSRNLYPNKKVQSYSFVSTRDTDIIFDTIFEKTFVKMLMRKFW